MPRLTRRAFVAASAATALPFAARANTASAEITPAPAEVQLVPPEYGPTRVWAYDGAIPGAGLRLPQGARLTRTLVNNLPDATTIHWHGIRLPNAMDGAGHLTQDPVAPGETFLYDFTLPDAGTYWFHPHHNSLEQVGRGLAAPLIVEEPEAPDVDADITFLVNDWRLDREAQIAADFGSMHDSAHAGRLGNHLTVNGTAEFARPAARHARLRLRLINASTDRILEIAATGLEGHLMALDGMPLATPEPFASLTLGPAQRADLFVDVTAAEGESAFLTSVEQAGTFALAGFPTGAGTASRRPAPSPLPPNRLAPLDLPGARSTEMTMEGGAMGGMMGGGVGMMQQMISRGMVWALNGTAGMPETPFIEAARGETIRIPILNKTAFAHAMHLHGHHFHEVTGAGIGPARDTILTPPRSQTEIAFVADNPGDWMFHCHMLSHQMTGMMSWIRVT